jgi:hypothetical protein
MGPPGRCSREFGMKWRVMLELVGPDGTIGVHEVARRKMIAPPASGFRSVAGHHAERLGGGDGRRRPC